MQLLKSQYIRSNEKKIMFQKLVNLDPILETYNLIYIE